MAATNNPTTLTARERQILAMLGTGAQNKEIAVALDCSPQTVKAHVRAVLRTLGARNRTEAAVVWRVSRLPDVEQMALPL